MIARIFLFPSLLLLISLLPVTGQAGDFITKTYYDANGVAHQIQVYDSRARSSSYGSSTRRYRSSYGTCPAPVYYRRPVGVYSYTSPTIIRTSRGTIGYSYSGSRSVRSSGRAPQRIGSYGGRR